METDSDDFLVAVDEFHHQDELLQDYRQIFLGGETFTAALAATQLDKPSVVIFLAIFGLIWLVGWFVVTQSRRTTMYEWLRRAEHLSKLYGELYEKFEGRGHLWASTWLQLGMPLSFAAIWIVLLLRVTGAIPFP